MLNRPDLMPTYAQKDVLLSVLDALYDVNCEAFFQEFAKHAHSLFVLNSTIALHLDSTSIVLYHHIDGEDKEALSIALDNLPQEQQDELKKLAESGCKYDKPVTINLAANGSRSRPIKIERGHSKAHRSDLGQIVIVSIVDGHGIPLQFYVADDNSNDKALFAEVAARVLPDIAGKYQETKYLSFDSADCTKKNLLAARKAGMYTVARVPDNLTLTREALSHTFVHQMLPVDPNEPEGKLYAPVSDTLYEDIMIKGFVYFNQRCLLNPYKLLRKLEVGA